MMKLTQILAMLGLPGDGIDGASEDASFRVDDQVDLTLALTADGQFLRLKVLIGHAPDPKRLSLNQRIAAANYAGALTGGGALGLNPVNGEILLFKELPVALCEDSGLQAVASRLIDAAIRLKADLGDTEGTASDGVQAPEPESIMAVERPAGWLRG